MSHLNQVDIGLLHSSLNMPINCHPMNLLPAFAPASDYNIADLLSKPLPTSTHHRYAQLVIGDDPTPLSASATPMTSVAPAATVDSLATVVASVSAAVPTSDSVSHPAPCFVDTGASLPVAPSCSDFITVTQAPCGLFRSASSLVSDSKVTSVVSNSGFKVASTPTDPHTLITGEDAAIDLSFPDSDSVDTVEFASTLVYSEFRHFGTATLVFLKDANSKLISILVEPTQVDWLHWVPLPRLTPTESYFHVSGFDYLQAFALFHLIPIWIHLLHFAVNLEQCFAVNLE